MSALQKSDLEKLAHLRLEEAACLLAAGHFSGAYYLGGYAVELALKACIAATFQSNAIPDRKRVERTFTDDLSQLVGLAELQADLLKKSRVDRAFAQNWEYTWGIYIRLVRRQTVRIDCPRSCPKLRASLARSRSWSFRMDQDVLVEGGASGLLRIQQAFQSKGLRVVGIYIIKLTSHDGYEERVIRLVCDPENGDLTRAMIGQLVELRRDKEFPKVDTGVRFTVVGTNDMEAARIIDYAKQLGGPPVVIRDAVWHGLFIEYALVASVPQADYAVA